MTKTILLTGATDGIGFETAKAIAALGHTLLIHGRSAEKLAVAKKALIEADQSLAIETYIADLSQISEVEKLAAEVAAHHSKVDVLINNAGVFKVPNARTAQGYDIRFVVNTVAPYLLTKRLLPLMPADGRVVNLSSAAQASVDLKALAGNVKLDHNQAYSQSKLAITMWSAALAQSIGDKGPAIIAVNPGSFLASKMVKGAYGVEGHDLSIGSDILVRAALSDEFATASGRYFDNDQEQFSAPHPDANDADKNRKLVDAMESLVEKMTA